MAEQAERERLAREQAERVRILREREERMALALKRRDADRQAAMERKRAFEQEVKAKSEAIRIESEKRTEEFFIIKERLERIGEEKRAAKLAAEQVEREQSLQEQDEEETNVVEKDRGDSVLSKKSLELKIRNNEWTLHEAAIMLDAYLQITDVQSRTEIIKRTSGRLRKLAQNQGYSIGKAFRNSNDVAWKMYSMEYSYSKGRRGVDDPVQVFEVIVIIYGNNKERYERILKDAQNIIGTNENDDELFPIGYSLQISRDESSETNITIANEKETGEKLPIAGEGNAFESATSENELVNIEEEQNAVELEAEPVLVETRRQDDHTEITEDMVLKELEIREEPGNLFENEEEQKIAFFYWMKEKQIATRTALSYVSLISSCGKYAVEQGITSNIIYLIADLKELQRVCKDIMEYRTCDGLNSYKTQLVRFYRFRSETFGIPYPPEGIDQNWYLTQIEEERHAAGEREKAEKKALKEMDDSYIADEESGSLRMSFKASELVGIIKGITFDGIINEKEVKRLSNWVDRYRNLAVDMRMAELIKLVDTVLEDGVIDEDERELMFHCAREISEARDEISGSKLFELNGIIEGIIADEEINEMEILRLKTWIEMNSHLRGNNQYDSIAQKLSEILEDGIITKDEQAELLTLLSNGIMRSKFEIKLEYLRKKVRAHKLIGIELIDLLDNEAVLERIHKMSEMQLRRMLSSYTGQIEGDTEIVFISLVLIAMVGYNGNFYSSVQKTYKSLYLRYSEQRIEGIIRTIINRYKLNRTEKVSRSRIINTVLSNTVVPSNYLPDFFDFVYDIYRVNFNCSLPKDIYEEFTFIYDGLRDNMLSDGNSIRISITKKTYKLIKATKLIVVDRRQVDAIIRLSIIVAKLIDKKVWNKAIKIHNPYLKSGFEAWAMQYDTDPVCKESLAVGVRSNWEPKFTMQASDIYLNPPVHKIQSEYDYNKIRIAVYNGEEELYSNTVPDIREIIGGYQVSVDRIKIKKPLGNVRYVVFVGKQSIYDSGEKLYREILVFNTSGDEISNNTDYSGLAAFCYRTKSKQLTPHLTLPDYMLAFDEVKKGNLYLFGDLRFYFAGMNKPGIFGKKYDGCWFIDPMNGRKAVYQSADFLVVENRSGFSSYELEINGIGRMLKSNDYEEITLDQIVRTIIKISLCESGIYSLSLYTHDADKRTRIASFEIVIDSGLSYKCAKLDDQNYQITIQSDLLDNTVDKEFNLASFSEMGFLVYYRGNQYRYCMPVDVDAYRISEGAWTNISCAIWCDDLKQDTVLDMYGNQADEICVYSPEGELLDEAIPMKQKGVYYQAAIGFLKSYKTSYDFVNLEFCSHGARKKTIKCLNRCILDKNETEILFNSVSKELTIVPCFEGKGKVYVVISDENEVCYKSEYLTSGDSVLIENLSSFKKYTISFYEKKKGLLTKKDNFMVDFHEVFYAWDDFVGHTFTIPKVYYDFYYRDAFWRKDRHFDTTYLTFTEKETADTYSGVLYTDDGKKKRYLSALNPISIEICSEVLGNGVELSLTKDGDGLLLDYRNNCVLNTIDNPKAVDIFSYILDVRGGIDS